MQILTRVWLKQELKRAKREGSKERQVIVEAVLNDSDLLELVHEANQAEYDYVKESRLKGGVFGGPFQDFLAWLFENRDAILAFILQIIQLFSILSPKP